MPTLVLFAGPNGAGKATFINGFLRERAEAFRFLNPDELARGLTMEGPACAAPRHRRPPAPI
jgi:predicted ABC-type ATPase